MEKYESDELPLFGDHKVVVVFEDDERYPTLFFSDRKERSTITQLENNEIYDKNGKLRDFKQLSETITKKLTTQVLNKVFNFFINPSLDNLDKKFALLQNVRDNIANIAEESYNLITSSPNSFAGFGIHVFYSDPL